MMLITGSNVSFADKVPCWFASKQTWIQICAPRGTNPNYPDGIEVGQVLRAIKEDVSCYKDVPLFVYAGTDTAAVPGDPTTTPLWDEYVIHKGTRLFISTTEFSMGDGDQTPSSDAPGVDQEPDMKYQMFIQDLVKWIPIAVPNPAFGKANVTPFPHSNCSARTLKKCLISTLGYPADSVNRVRLFKNSKGFAKGDAITGNATCWPNPWYYVVLSDTANPWRSYGDRLSAIGRWPALPDAELQDDEADPGWEQVEEDELGGIQ